MPLPVVGGNEKSDTSNINVNNVFSKWQFALASLNILIGQRTLYRLLQSHANMHNMYSAQLIHHPAFNNNKKERREQHTAYAYIASGALSLSTGEIDEPFFVVVSHRNTFLFITPRSRPSVNYNAF